MKFIINNKYDNQLLYNIYCDTNNIYIKNILPKNILDILNNNKFQEFNISKYLLFFNHNNKNNNLLLLQYNNSDFIHNNDDFLKNKNIYTPDELNKKILLKNKSTIIIRKIIEIDNYYFNLNNNDFIDNNRLDIHKNVLIKTLIINIINDEDLTQLNNNIVYNDINYNIIGNINDIIIINDINYKIDIINYDLIYDNILDVNNNSNTNIKIIDNYKYDFNKKQIIYNNIIDEDYDILISQLY
jgi:hypothetical protein